MAETVVSSKQENVKGQVINMKALGINKKIDELGRIVIPKDVRIHSIAIMKSSKLYCPA